MACAESTRCMPSWTHRLASTTASDPRRSDLVGVFAAKWRSVVAHGDTRVHHPRITQDSRTRSGGRPSIRTSTVGPKLRVEQSLKTVLIKASDGICCRFRSSLEQAVPLPVPRRVVHGPLDSRSKPASVVGNWSVATNSPVAATKAAKV